MHRFHRPIAAIALFAALHPAVAADETSYTGMAEASAAVRLDSRYFVVAEDECNQLLVYRDGQPDPVGPPIDLEVLLHTGGEPSDLEAAARADNVIYWISSHSRTSKGKFKPERQRFFATPIDTSTAPPTIQASKGQSTDDLLKHLTGDAQLKSLGLAKASERPPEDEKGGLNIEGLAAADTGLLIGFRNPLIEEKALIIPLENPAETVRGERPKFGAPITLDLNKRGVRSIDRIGDHYLIIAGPVKDNKPFGLYRWSGKPGDPARQLFEIEGGLHPEALVPVPDSNDVVLLSDDGDISTKFVCGSPKKRTQAFRTRRVQAP